jgi:hypothetical protein
MWFFNVLLTLDFRLRGEQNVESDPPVALFRHTDVRRLDSGCLYQSERRVRGTRRSDKEDME